MTGCPTDLLAALQAAGLSPAKGLDLPGDGTLIRYRGEGDKPGARNCWVVFHDGQYPAAMFGSWRTGCSATWRPATAGRLTAEQRAAMQRQLQAMNAARATEQTQVHAAARARAAKLWERARPATGAHTYLQLKGVHAFAVRQLRDMLVIPARDTAGVLHTLQFIGPDGVKRFLSGGRKAGCYFAIGKPTGLLLLCEGYATGATLHMATGHAVAVAFDAGNLLPAANALRAKFPGTRLVFCADNDRFTPGNPGVKAARAAARAVGGVVAIPRFRDGPNE